MWRFRRESIDNRNRFRRFLYKYKVSKETICKENILSDPLCPSVFVVFYFFAI